MEDPVFVNYLRIGYVSAQVISIAIYLYIQMRVSEGARASICMEGGSNRDGTPTDQEEE